MAALLVIVPGYLHFGGPGSPSSAPSGPSRSSDLGGRTPWVPLPSPTLLSSSAFNLSISVAPPVICGEGTRSCSAATGIARVTLNATAEASTADLTYPRVDVVFILETTPYDGGADPASMDLRSCAGTSVTSLCNEADTLRTFTQYSGTILAGIQAAHPGANVSFAMLDGFATHQIFDDGDGAVVWQDLSHFTSNVSAFAKGVNTSLAAGYPWSGSSVIGESDLTDNFLTGPAITQVYGALAGGLVNWTSSAHRVVVWVGSAAPRDPNYVENYTPTFSDNAYPGTCGACLAPSCEPSWNFSTGASPACEGWASSSDGVAGDSIAALATNGPDCRGTPGQQCTIDIVNPRTVPTDATLTGWRYVNNTTARTDATHVLAAGCDLSAATGGSWDGPDNYACGDGRAGTLPVHPTGSTTLDTSLIGALENVSLGRPFDTGYAPPANGSEFRFVPGPSVGLATPLNATTSCRPAVGTAFSCPLPVSASTAAGPTLEWNFTSGVNLHVGDRWSASFDVEVDSLLSGTFPIDRCWAAPCASAGSGAMAGVATGVQYIDPASGNWSQVGFPLAEVGVLAPRPLAAAFSYQLLTATSPTTVGFAAAASGGVPPYQSFTWTFGDGSTAYSNLSTTNHTYPTAGVYAVILEVRDDAGQRQAAQHTIDVPSPLGVDLTATPGALTVGTSTTLYALTTGGLPGPSYLWDGLPAGCVSANASSLLCRPTSPGTFTVSVQVTDEAGTNATASTQLLVAAQPVVGLTWSGNLVGCSGGPPSSASFVPSARGGTAPLEYTWTFGDGATAITNGSVDHQYTHVARFNVTVVVTDASGANATATTVVYATFASCPPPAPNASGSAESGNWTIIGGVLLVAVALAALALVVRRRRRGGAPPPADET